MEKQRKIVKKVTSDLNKQSFDLSDEAGRVHAAKCIGAANKQIENRLWETIFASIRAGEILISLKDHCEHGEFGNLLEQHASVSHRQANKYMQAARGWAFLQRQLPAYELEQIENGDVFESLNQFIRITRDEMETQKVVADQSNVVRIGNGFSSAERAEYEEMKAHEAQLEKLWRDHDAEVANMKDHFKAMTEERESDPEYQKALRKAKWNWKQMAKQYTPDDRFFGLLHTPRFSDLDNLKLGFDFTDDELFEAFKAALIFGHRAGEKKKGDQFLWDLGFEQQRDQLDEIREWHDKIGMCLQRLDDEGFRIEKPMPVREVE